DDSAGWARWAESMPHKFKVGQLVDYHPPRGIYAPRGPYLITAQLPKRDGEFEYTLMPSWSTNVFQCGPSDLVADANSFKVLLLPMTPHPVPSKLPALRSGFHRRLNRFRYG